LETDKGRLDLKLDISYKAQYLESDSEESVRDVCFREKISKRLKSTFNLGVLEGKQIKNLSGGELQRFSVARCLAKDADIYLIDEPSAYLDVEERISVAKAIKDIMVERGKTAFVVDHDLLVVSYLADSIINFDGEGGVKGKAGEVVEFEKGVSELLKSLDVTLRKDKESGRPRINKRGSVLDREQKAKGKWAVF
jgi:ATP-binding cassette, sub-family E, member 1